MTIQKQRQIESTQSQSQILKKFGNKRPPDVFFNASFDKNHLKSVIAWFLDHYGEKKTLDLVETFKQVGFHQATRAGVSLGVDDLQIPPQKAPLLSQAYAKRQEVTHSIQTGNLTSVEKSQRLIDTWNQTSETLRQAAVQNFRATNPVNPVYMMAFSGARGNISQVRQLVAMRGLMADPQGNILEFPIQSNFREGLTVSEYMISCYGARKGLVDTALRTATSGYLTRRLVDAAQHVVVYVKDCGTKKGIVIKETHVEQRLIGRVLLKDLVLDSNVVVKKNTLISPLLANQIARKHKKVLIRSPLTCQTEKSVCQLCYGLDLGQGKLVSIGEAVGIIAAQSIGEPGTQLTMRTFHTGGVGVFSDQAMKSFIAPFDGKIEFLESLAGLFVRTPHGNIVYLLKQKIVDKTKPILRLISSHPARKPSVYEIQHGEVPANSLLWVKQGEGVKTGQLLVQASRLEKTSGEMPESIHPVKAPFSGEIFLKAARYVTVEHQTEKKKKVKTEISPLIPTLKELGNFWIFSTYIQKESQSQFSQKDSQSSFFQSQSQFLEKFFKKGDLFSTETPINQHDLHIAWKAQLRLVNSSLVYGHTPVDLVFAKILYSGSFYFFLSQKIPFFGSGNGEKKSQPHNLFSYTTNPKSTRLTWYPSFKNVTCDVSSEKGYSCFFDFHSESLSTTHSVETQTPASSQNHSSETKDDILEVDTLETLEGTRSEKVGFSKTVVSHKSESVHQYHTNCVLSPHQSFVFKPVPKNKVFWEWARFDTQKVLPSSCLLVTGHDHTLSKRGVFQIEQGRETTWSTKTKSQGCFVKNSLAARHKLTTSGFLEKGLKISQKVLEFQSGASIIEKKQSWVCIPETEIRSVVPSQFPGVILEPGKQFEKLIFPNSYVSANLLGTKTFFLLQSKTQRQRSSLWYSLQEVWSPTKQFSIDLKQTSLLSTSSQNNVSSGRVINSPKNLQVSQSWDQDKRNQKQSHTTSYKASFPRRESTVFVFYKKQTKNKNILWDSVFGLPLPVPQICKNLGRGSETLRDFYQELRSLGNQLKTKRRLPHLVLFQKNYQKVLPNRDFLKKNWLVQKKEPRESSLNSPLFTKQRKTNFQPGEKLNPRFTVVTLSSSKWGGFQSLFKVELEWITPNSFNKHENLKQHSFLPTKTKGEEVLGLPGFSVFFYRRIRFDNATLFDFRTFHESWVLPEYMVTQAFVKAKTIGEFRRIQIKRDDIFISFLRNHDVATLKLPTPSSEKTYFPIQVGQPVRWGQELCESFVTPVSGQIMKVTRDTITIRTGMPLLASIRGLVHITDNDLVEKNDLLITLRSKRLQTEDIVQGIPKIEQLFEARETQGGQILKNNIHNRLNLMFRSALQRKPFLQAVEWSLREIQKFLVESILEAYSNQGVHIAEKHVEVVVRQMTARVRILRGGHTGFLAGEFVQQRLIEQINVRMKRGGRRPASYEPVVLGITKSVLQSESFLLAVGFQQVSQVLVRSALSKKTDFLRGLHENIMVGQPMPAGTALIRPKKSKNSLVETPTVTETNTVSEEKSGTENLLKSQEDFVDIIAQPVEASDVQDTTLSESSEKTFTFGKQKAGDVSVEVQKKKRKTQKNTELEEGNEPDAKKS